MSLASDLLEQAKHLSTRERRRPRQASLRRSVSTAYYALFHLLVEDASRLLIGGNVPHRVELRMSLARAFGHADMKKVASAFKSRSPPLEWRRAAGQVSADLKLVAETFVELQQVRHEADYELRRQFSRREVEELLRRCDDAFRAWRRCRRDADGETFMVALLAHRQLRS